MRPLVFLAVIVGLFAVLAGAALLSGEPSFAVPVIIVGLVVIGVWGIARLIAFQALKKHGNRPEAAAADADDPVPSTGLTPDETTALGDTAQAHAEVSPHDFPKGSPERAAVETQAREETSGRPGTTAGHRDPADREGRTQPGPGKAEGYAGEQAASASRARS
jgi:hypothetical protein